VCVCVCVCMDCISLSCPEKSFIMKRAYRTRLISAYCYHLHGGGGFLYTNSDARACMRAFLRYTSIYIYTLCACVYIYMYVCVFMYMAPLTRCMLQMWMRRRECCKPAMSQNFSRQTPFWPLRSLARSNFRGERGRAQGTICGTGGEGGWL
jgi:hypothetical protein